ncbi:hypothetical protein ACPF8X_03800 [Streptomyces sp. G35A]
MSAELIQEIARRIREELGVTGVSPFEMDDEMSHASREIWRSVTENASVFPTAV